MKEAFIPHEYIMAEKREQSFEQMAKDTRFYSKEDYEKIFSHTKEHWGIDSPAFVLDRKYFKYNNHQELLPKDIEGDALIAFNRDSVPDPEYLNFFKEHEYSEYYIEKKEGFNLQNALRLDWPLPIHEKQRPAHRYATLKEFEAAATAGKLDEYMQWWREYYQKNIDEVMALPQADIIRITQNYGVRKGDREAIVDRIKANQALKEKIYEKVKSRPKITKSVG